MPVLSERPLRRDTVRWLESWERSNRLHKTFWCATWNGAYIRAENAAEQKVIRRVMAAFIAESIVKLGLPDLLFGWSTGFGGIELKRPEARDLFGVVQRRGTPSPAQRTCEGVFAAYGLKHAYCYSVLDVERTLVAWGRLEAADPMPFARRPALAFAS